MIAWWKLSNINHSNFTIDGVTVIESWLIEDPENDKSRALGFKAFPKGTWFATYKIDNKELWQGIKNGEVKGFSIEGFFIDELVSMHKDIETPTKEDKLYNQIGEILENTDLSDDDKYDKIQGLFK